jgi:Phosphotransferase enzyme family
MTPEHLLHVILPQRSDKSQILILPHESGWTLPTIVPEEWPDYDFGMVNFGMKTRSVFGWDVTALRCAYFEHENDAHGHRFVFAMESRDESFQTPEGARWVTEGELQGLTLAHEYLRPILENYFHEQTTGKFPWQRAPWAFPGWQDRAMSWIKAQVAAQDLQFAGEIEVMRKWCITCVMRVPTSVGDLYFKAVPPTFAREIAITRYLAEQHPHNIPSIVAYHEAERWILMRDFGQQLLGDSQEIAHWERAVREFAALQLHMMGHIDALLERGALDYRLEILPEKLDALLVDSTILRPDLDITAEEIERARSFAPRIKALMEELRAYDIPSTIAHSDFHVWNVAVQDGRTIFFDWTDASVGHPFFDMGLFFDRASEHVFPDAPETIAHLREIYLQSLTPLAPLETLQKALFLGEMMGLVHQVVNYHHLLYQIEPAERWSLDFVGSMMKRLLVRLEAMG